MKKIISIFVLTISVCVAGCVSFSEYGVEENAKFKIPQENISFMVKEDGCKNIAQNLRLCLVSGKINDISEYQNTWIDVGDEHSQIGHAIYYNDQNNSIYAMSFNNKEGEINYNDKTYRYKGSNQYYNIGRAKVENRVLKPEFTEGAWFSYRKRGFSDIFGYSRLFIHISGFLKPEFTSYFINEGGKATEVMPIKLK